ncbi:hypothetical protein N476_22780 [Pseudoalteromonas luteoviolacea H33]|uniref:Fibronectin type-III domain-containing protein n=2 Tax=Pseudoalteromonas luteoviolacea TaxID=43657 RepID=A0A162AD58_9GAMM|nr:hypothetical protein N476_22780 [Pseudoalteromonas luteoviolacea H33]KZN74641.1 hypothetical protein N477_21675 [Pseudoalteromonas luteoviolacea H33-S]
MIYRFLIFTALIAAPFNILANIKNTPVISYYLTNNVSESKILTDEIIHNGELDIRWHDENENNEYSLIIRNNNSLQSQTLYSGNNLYFKQKLELTSGKYTVSLICDEPIKCTNTSVFEKEILVVNTPNYLHASYDYDTQIMHISWESLSNDSKYLLEQSDDGGTTWLPIVPHRAFVNTPNHLKEHYNGINAQVGSQHEQDTTSLLLDNDAHFYIPNDINKQLIYRVKECFENQCGKYKTSSPIKINIASLKPLIAQSGFENGYTILNMDEKFGDITVRTLTPINSEEPNYLNLNIKDWGFAHYNHIYGWHGVFGDLGGEYLSGISITGKLRVSHLSPNSKVSITPIAYYNSNHRVKGSELVISEAGDKVINFRESLWLDSTKRTRYISFEVRLLGEHAEIQLDDIQLYEGAALAQAQPTFSVSAVNLGQNIEMGWTPFGDEHHQYHIEYSPYGQNTWQTFYYGGMSTRQVYDISFLPANRYQFRLRCEGIVGCPTSGYFYDTSSILYQLNSIDPQQIQTRYDATSQTIQLKWPTIPGAFGYTIFQTINGQSTTRLIPPGYVWAKRWRDEVVFAKNETVLPVSQSGTYTFAVTPYSYFQQLGSMAVKSVNVHLPTTPTIVTPNVGEVRNLSISSAIKTHGRASVQWSKPTIQGMPSETQLTYKLYLTLPNTTEPLKPILISGQQHDNHHVLNKYLLTEPGLYHMEMQACTRNTICGPKSQLSFNVEQGPPPAPEHIEVSPIFAWGGEDSDQLVVLKGSSLTLSWTMNTSFSQEVTFNISLLANTEGAQSSSFVPLKTDYPYTQFDYTFAHSGVYLFAIRTCTKQGGCATYDSKTLAVHVVDDDFLILQPPIQFEFSTEIGKYWSLGDTATLQWQMPSHYSKAFIDSLRYNLYTLDKYNQVVPLGDAPRNLQKQQWQYTFSELSAHTLFVEACTINGDCSAKTKLVIDYIQPGCTTIPKLSKTNSKAEFSWCKLMEPSLAYLEVMTAHCGQECASRSEPLIWLPYHVSPQLSQQSQTITTQETGIVAVKARACDINNQCYPWSNTIELDFNILKEPKTKQVIFIHTDLLGSPVAESTMERTNK